MPITFCTIERVTVDLFRLEINVLPFQSEKLARCRFSDTTLSGGLFARLEKGKQFGVDLVKVDTIPCGAPGMIFSVAPLTRV